MNLALNLALADGYRSPSQRARRLTEGWFEAQMYCPACPAPRLVRKPDNTKVVDFVCKRCGAEFQLKAKSGKLGRKLRDAAYEPMMARISASKSPHFAFLAYSSEDWTVRSLLLVPGHFITPSAIERCAPLSVNARRAGWVGCNLLTDAIPDDGRIAAISEGVAQSPQVIRDGWSRFDWLAKKGVESRGWTADVLRLVRRLGRGQFALSDIYGCEDELQSIYPSNHNVRAKIRQQLQVLRDNGVLRFLGKGRYETI